MKSIANSLGYRADKNSYVKLGRLRCSLVFYGDGKTSFQVLFRASFFSDSFATLLIFRENYFLFPHSLSYFWKLLSSSNSAVRFLNQAKLGHG